MGYKVPFSCPTTRVYPHLTNGWLAEEYRKAAAVRTE